MNKTIFRIVWEILSLVFLGLAFLLMAAVERFKSKGPADKNSGKGSCSSRQLPDGERSSGEHDERTD